MVVRIFADAFMHVGSQIGRVPILDRSALQLLAAFATVAEHRVAVVAFAAVPKALDEVGPAIDLGDLLGSGWKVPSWKNASFQASRPSGC